MTIRRIPDVARAAVSGADVTEFGVRGAPLVLIAGDEEGYAAPRVEAVEPGQLPSCFRRSAPADAETPLERSAIQRRQKR